MAIHVILVCVCLECKHVKQGTCIQNNTMHKDIRLFRLIACVLLCFDTLLFESGFTLYAIGII